MAQTPEGKVKARIKTILKKWEVPHFSPVTAGFGHSGWFDIIGCYKGHFIGIEVKATKQNQPTALQSMVAEEVFEAGGVVLLIHDANMEVLEATLMRIKNSAEFDGIKVWPPISVTRSPS